MSDTNTQKVARPATPNLDLLGTLNDEVYFPVGYQKLAAAGVQLTGEQDLVQALTTGSQVCAAVETRKQAARAVTPVQAHAQKVAAAMGLQPDRSAEVSQQDNAINADIDASPELAAKFAAALGA